MRPTITLEASKWFTPVYALAVQGQTGFNYDKIGSMMPASEFGKSKTAFDAAQVMLLNKFNLSNLFGGYKGEPRLFEVEAYFGAGYTHFYMNGGKDNGIDGFSSKTGLNFNFNLGSAKAWQFNIKPAITWILDANKYAVVADDLAKESRAFSREVPETGCAIEALADGWCNLKEDPELFDPKKAHLAALVEKAKESGAQGVVILLAKFCDPEEFEAPLATKELREAGIPVVTIEVDQSTES